MEFDNFKKIFKHIQKIKNKVHQNQMELNLFLRPDCSESNADLNENEIFGTELNNPTILRTFQIDVDHVHAPFSFFETEVLKRFVYYHTRVSQETLAEWVEATIKSDNNELAYGKKMWVAFCYLNIEGFLKYKKRQFRERINYFSQLLKCPNDNILSSIDCNSPYLGQISILIQMVTLDKVLSYQELFVLTAIFAENEILELSYNHNEYDYSMIVSQISNRLDDCIRKLKKPFYVHDYKLFKNLIISLYSNWILKNHLLRKYHKIAYKGLINKDEYYGIKKIDPNIIDVSNTFQYKNIGWENVEFHNKYYHVYPDIENKTNYYRINDVNSTLGLNKIKGLFCTKCPPLKAVCKNNTIESIENIPWLSELISLFEYKPGDVPLSKPENPRAKKVVRSNMPQKRLRKQEALKVVKELKSRYLDYLSRCQLDDYKVICCLENRVNVSGQQSSEYSFIFTIKEYKHFLYLAFENSEESRSTYIFPVLKRKWEEGVDILYSYFASEKWNKRQSLSEGFSRLRMPGEGGMIRIYHTDYIKWVDKIKECHLK